MITTQERHIDIKGLAIPEPLSRMALPFDPERDVTSEDWQNMRETLRRADNRRMGVLASRMSIIFPERKKEIRTFLPPTSAILLSDLEDSEHALERVANAKLLYPENFENIWETPNIDQIKLQTQNLNMFSRETLSKIIPEAFVLYPNNFHTLKSDEVKEYLERCLIEKDGGPTVGGFGDGYINQARGLRTWVSLKLLYPEDFKPLTDEEWKKPLEALRQGSQQIKWSGSVDEVCWFAELASNMKLLAAKKIIITNKGLKITMQSEKKGFTDHENPVPVRRRF